MKMISDNSIALKKEQRIQPRGLTIDEAAAYAGIHRTSIYRLNKAGKLKIRRVAGRSLVLKDELDELMENS